MIRFFLERRVLSTLLSFFIITVGFYQFFTVRREAFPDVSYDWVQVSTLFPGGSPEEVDRLVTQKVEEQLRGISNLDHVESSSIEGVSNLFIQFQEGLSRREADRVITQIQQGVNRVRDLPALAEKPVVEELTTGDRPLLSVSVAGGTLEERTRLSQELKDVFEELPDVSKVDRAGLRKREIWVEADLDKLMPLRLTMAEIADKIRRANVDASAGTVEVGKQELWLRVVGDIRTAEDVGAVILRGSDDRSYLRVRDVARVSETFGEPRVVYKALGLPAIELQIRKLKKGDTIKMVDAVRRLVSEYGPRASERGIRLVVSNDISFFIRRRLRIMTNNLLQGGVLILVALFAFLDWRLALVSAAGVPISFAMAFLFAVPLGFTINLLSLMGLIIVMGMLDDDSVVVAENIYRHLEMGKKPIQAAVDGAREVAVPVIASVATTSCAFMPFAMISGIMGKFLWMIPVIVVMCFVASLFEAFFILPAHVLDMMPLGKPVEETKDPRWYVVAQAWFRRTLAWSLKHRVLFLLLMTAFVLGTGALARWRLKLVLFPEGLVDQVFIQVDMPHGTSLTETEKSFKAVEDALNRLPPSELEAFTETVGLKGHFDEGSTPIATHYAQAMLFLTPEDARPRKTADIIEALKKDIGLPPGAQRVVFKPRQTGPPVGKPVFVRILSRDASTLNAVGDRFLSEMRAMPGLRDIEDSRKEGKSQVRVVLNDREAAYAGLHTAETAQNLLFAVDGGEATRIRRPGEEDEIKVKVRLLPAQRARFDRLLDLEVMNDRGRPVRLGAVASLRETEGPSFLYRYDFKPVVFLSAELKEGTTSREANDRLQKKFDGIPKEFPGTEVLYGGEEKETQKSMESLGRAFLVAIFLDFIILASVFQSYLQPFIILLTIPIGLLGVVYALLLHGMPASFMALLGIVAMTGVVVNNAIVLVNFINENLKNGMDIRTAAVEAAATRLRPIWASSITTLLGLFPTAYGWGGYEPFVAPMALSMAWGLTCAMPLTLFLIPAATVMADDAAKAWKRALLPLGSLARRFFRRSGPRP
jgi:multidrug efflux pump subunit AcrB